VEKSFNMEMSGEIPECGKEWRNPLVWKREEKSLNVRKSGEIP